MAKALRVGDPAPDFALQSASGQSVRLSDFRGRADVVLFFYPRNHTPVCTAQACSFRDAYADFQAAGAEVIGISSNTLESHSRFAALHHLPFILLSDPDGAVSERFGVQRHLWVLPGRETFLIDKQGIVRHKFAALWLAQKHVEEALRVLQQVRAAG